MAIDWGGWASAGADALGTVVPGGQFVDDVFGFVGDLFGGGGPEGVSSRGEFEGLPLNDFLDSIALNNRAKQRMFTAWQAVGRPVTALDGLGRPQTDPTGYSPVLKKALGVALELHVQGDRAATQFLQTVASIASGQGNTAIASTIRSGMEAATRQPSQPAPEPSGSTATGTPSQGSSPTMGLPRTDGFEFTQPEDTAAAAEAEGDGMSTSILLILAGVGILGYYLLTESGMGD